MSTGTEAASNLLRIDFEAALDKLAWSQLQGTWQLPAEMARLAIGSGATSIEFQLEPRHLALVARGARLDHQTIAGFASVLDRRLEAADRHAAMVDLEERDAFVLSAIACSTLRSLTLTTGGGHGLRVELGADGDLRVINPGDSALGRPDLQLVIDGLVLDAERASKWLRRAGRFADVPIIVGGLRINRGFRGALVERRLEINPADARPGKPYCPGRPLAVNMAIQQYANSPRLWLLRHGIIATHATVPGYPAFEAAIEMSPTRRGDVDSTAVCTSAVTGAALRERLSPYIESLVDESVNLMIKLATIAESMPESTRARVARLLLEAALKRRRLSEVSGVDIFPLVNTGGRRLVSIDIISRLVRIEEGGTCALEAIPPGQDPKRFALSDRGTLALSQSERALLGELLRVVFSNPPARARQPLGRRLLQQMTDRIPALRLGTGQPITESELSKEEQGFMTHFRVAAADGDLPATEFRSGATHPYKTSDGVLLLPRDNAVVRACVRSVASDPSWLYPAAAALLGGKELPGPEVRRRWFARFEG